MLSDEIKSDAKVHFIVIGVNSPLMTAWQLFKVIFVRLTSGERVNPELSSF